MMQVQPESDRAPMARPKGYDRSVVLERAMHSFWLKGHRATSVDDLLSTTGLNRFSLYREFGSKDRLYVEAFNMYKDTVIEEVMADLERADEGLDALGSYFANYIDARLRAAENEVDPASCLSLLNAVEAIGRRPEAAEIMRGIITRTRTAFETVLRRAIQLNEVPADAQVADIALMLVGVTYGLDTMSKFLDEAALNAYVDQVMRSVRA